MAQNHHFYLAYKPAGVDWLGDVPVHWEVRRLRTVADMRVSNVDKHTKQDEFPVRLCNYMDVYKHDRITLAMPFMTATASRTEIERCRLERDDVLITKDSEAWDDIGVPALVTEVADDLLAGYHLALLRPVKEILGAYLARTLQSEEVAYQFAMRANGVTRYGLTHPSIKSVSIPLPPLTEQASIVRYLDHMDRRIRQYVSAKRKLIALLEEEKQAVINQAVTRGLDPNARLKPSGVEWLGDVPEHWEVCKIKNLARSDYKSFVDGDWIESPYITSDGIRLIQTGNIGIGEYREKGFRYISERTFKALRCTEFQPRDVLICRLGEPVARACLAPNLGTRMITSVDVCILKQRGEVNGKFIVYSMSSRQYLGWVNSLVRGSTRDRVSRSMLGSFSVPLPPFAEQASIVEYLDKATAHIDTAITRARRQIELVEEYRTRLIADVVTGKLDVRGAAARLPDEPDDADGTEADGAAEDVAGELARADAV